MDPTPAPTGDPSPSPAPTPESTPPPSFSFHNVIGADGKFSEGWQNSLPDEYNDYKPTLANFRDMPGLSKALKDSMTAARSKTEGMVKVPGADATPEDIATYRKAIGIPEDAKGYDFTKAKLPEGVTLDQMGGEKFAQIAHEAGVAPAQAEKFFNAFAEHLGETRNQFQVEGKQFLESRDAKLRESWGSNFEKRSQDADRAAASLGVNPELLKVMEPEIAMAFARVTELISEDKLITPNQFANKLTPASQAKAIIEDTKGPFWDSSNPQHKEYVERYKDLLAQSTGEKR